MMFRLSIPVLLLAIVAWIAAEMFVFHLVASRVGGLLAFVLFVLKSVAGFMFVGQLVRQRLRGLTGFRMVELDAVKASSATLKVIGAGLLIVPGFLAGLIGLALLTPSIRNLLTRRAVGRMASPRDIDLDGGEWRDTTPTRRRLPRKAPAPQGEKTL